MELCEEMKKLRKLLTEKGIEWHDESSIYTEEFIGGIKSTMPYFVDSSIYRTHFDIDGIHYSVINGFGTYGGFNPFKHKNYGLLELRINEDEPTGWHSADDIMDMINEDSDKVL